MAYQALGLGTSADDGTGDSIRAGGTKVNANFVEIYTLLGTGTALSSGISATATVVTLASPVITGVLTLADGSAGAPSFTNDGDTNTGIYFSAADQVAVSTGGTARLTVSSTAATFAGNIAIPNDGDIGSAGATDAIQISSAGIVTFKDDILIKDAGTIGNASVAAVMTLASTGIVTFVDDILIKDGGTIGAASADSAITIASTGVVTFDKQVQWKKGGDLASATSLTIDNDGNYFDVTGTTTITSFSTVGIGTIIKLHFDGVVTLTHDSTDLILAGAANFTTEAGDELEFVEYASGDWRMTGWSLAGTAPGGGGGGAFLGEGASGASVGDSGDIIRVNQQTLDTSQSMSATDNGSATGPISIADGVTLTISSGATFTVI